MPPYRVVNVPKLEQRLDAWYAEHGEAVLPRATDPEVPRGHHAVSSKNLRGTHHTRDH